MGGGLIRAAERRPAAAAPRPRVGTVTGVGMAGLLLALLAGTLLGPAPVTAAGLWAALLDAAGLVPLPPEHARDAAILTVIRGPRVLLGAVLGAGLAVSGAVMQGLFRNPLADPGLIGVSAGAALAAVGAIVLGPSLFGAGAGSLGLWLLPVAAFAGGLALPGQLQAGSLAKSGT